MQALIDAGQYREAHRLAHTIKGVAATLGAEALQSAAKALETRFHSALAGHEPSGWASELSQFAADLEALRMVAENWPSASSD